MRAAAAQPSDSTGPHAVVAPPSSLRRTSPAGSLSRHRCTGHASRAADQAYSRRAWTSTIEARRFAPLRGVLDTRSIARRRPRWASCSPSCSRRSRRCVPLYAAADPRDARRQIATLDVARSRTPTTTRARRRRLGASPARPPGAWQDTDPAPTRSSRSTAARRAAGGDRRAPGSTSHRRDQQLAARAASTGGLRHALGTPEVPELSDVEVEFVPYVEAVSAVIAEDRPGLRAYLRYHAARALAAVLPAALDAEVFDFAQRTARGAREMPPRWRRCLALVDRDLGDDVGRLFVARWFPEVSRARARAQVERIVAALRRDLAADWLGAAARAPRCASSTTCGSRSAIRMLEDSDTLECGPTIRSATRGARAPGDRARARQAGSPPIAASLSSPRAWPARAPTGWSRSSSPPGSCSRRCSTPGSTTRSTSAGSAA
jgi:hypothetical protein